MSKGKATFRAWLRDQERDDTATGDLARDLRADSCAKGLRSAASIRSHMESEHRPSDAALETLDDADRQWRQA